MTVRILTGDCGRDSILIELNEEYARLARRRLRADLSRVESDLAEEREPFGMFAA